VSHRARSGVAFDADTWAAVLRALKPSAHMLCFGGTRTVHRMTCAIEDAEFEIRDTLMWVYGVAYVRVGAPQPIRRQPEPNREDRSRPHRRYQPAAWPAPRDSRQRGRGSLTTL
jgi:hypothetical protein